MKSRTKILLAMASLAMACAALFLAHRWLHRPAGVTASAPEQAQTSTPALPARVDETALAAVAAEAESGLLREDNAEEVSATRRMYVAHESLRIPEVADPDSEANREILETMVAKALGRPTPASSSETAP